MMEAEKEGTDLAMDATGKDERISDNSEKTVDKSERKRSATDDDDLPVEKKMKIEEENMEDQNIKPSKDQKSEKDENLKDEDVDKEIKSENVDQVKSEKVDQVKSEKVEKDAEIDSDDEPLSLKKEKISHAKVEERAGSEHSDDSEKENKNNDLPMDLSTKSSQDIIMLSDESEDEMSKIQRVRRELTLGDMKLKAKMIKRLQAELRNEEAKLVLLKKMRQSQMSAQISENNSANKPQRPTQQHSQPPPLIRGNQPQQQMQARPAHSQPPQLVRGNVPPGANQNKGAQGPPPLLPSRVQDQRQLMQNQMQLLQQRGGSPANIHALRGSQAAQAEALRQMQQAQRAAEETPAQRQAAAKLALRKQLEKTLLQIPPPKPPPPEMNFIPSLASPDFIYLLGLEEAVNFIIDSTLISKGAKSPDDKLVCNPFTCVQCGSDYTPVWKREKPGSKNVICEKCVTTNQKKALKQEHTNRLKSAFVKALQQEQEIERMQSQEAKAAAASGSTPATTAAAQPQAREGREARDSPSARSAQASAANYKEVAETLRQHQNLLQAQAASLRMGHPLGLQGLNARFPYQLPLARASDLARATEMQRQYLLDMIPKGGIPWNQ